MKKIFMLVVSAILVLTTLPSASGQGLFAPKKPVPNTRGKATVKELAKEIHTALLTGNTDRLSVFMPTDDELTWVRKANPTEEVKELVNNMSSESLEESMDEDLTIAQKQLAADSVTTYSTTITAVTTSRVDPKMPALIPVTITLTDAKQKPGMLAFEAIRINKRIYLLRNLQVKRELQAVNMKQANP
jgi:hypothetical protein